MPNKGIAPFDPETEVGQFRVRAGDTLYTPIAGEPGYGTYEKWGDDEILAFLAVASSPTWAIYEAYIQLATAAAIESASIKDYDLQVDTTKRAEQLRLIAGLWKDRATEEDATSGNADFFDVFSTVGEGDFIPEGTIPIYGRQYTWAKWR